MSRAGLSTVGFCCGLALAGPAWAGTYQQLYSFQGGNDGANSAAGLLDFSGTLYGTTGSGGNTGSGTVFSLNPATGSETVLYTFQDGIDGADPIAALIKLDGKLYGTAYFGGINDGGTVFSINPTTGNQKVVYAFPNGSDGNNPQGGLINVSGMLLGTTVYGGNTKCGETGGCGTVFAVNPKTGGETVLHAFLGGTDGIFPVAGLVNFSGAIYGTTLYGGGTNNGGTVFSVNPTTGVEAVVHAFLGGNDGLDVQAGLTKVGAKLYGTTLYGGVSGGGTVFTIVQATGVESVVYAFQGGADGANPEAGLTKVGPKLYGTTYAGGAGHGTIFSVDLKTGAESVEYDFQGGNDGAAPQANLINVDGTLYGTTTAGGATNDGTVFSYTP